MQQKKVELIHTPALCSQTFIELLYYTTDFYSTMTAEVASQKPMRTFCTSFHTMVFQFNYTIHK